MIFKGFEVIPAVDLRGGRCVQLVQGVPGSEVISLDDPVGQARSWVMQGANTLHLIDLDGAIEGERKNAPLVKRIREELQVPIEVGGGIRTRQDAEELLRIGVDRIILSTAAIRNPDLVRELAQDYGEEHIMVALDARDGEVAIEGWQQKSGKRPEDVAQMFEELGAGSILFTNIDTEGLLSGIDPVPTRRLVESLEIPVVASGGVTTLQDLVLLEDTGAAAVVVGTALYTGRFTLKEAMKVVR